MSCESLNSTNTAPITMTSVLGRAMLSKMESTPFAKEKLNEANKSNHKRNTASVISN